MSADDRPVERPDSSAVARNQAANQAFLLRVLDVQNALITYQPPKRDMIALLALKTGDNVLDEGCGTGDATRVMAGLVGPKGRVAGIDRSDFMLDEARRRAVAFVGMVDFTLGDVQDLTYADNTFDACRCERVFQWLPDSALAMREIVRVTKPGGRIVVADSDWQGCLCSDPVSQAFWESMRQGVVNPAIGRRLSTLFRESGLQDISVRPHWLGPLGADCNDEVVESLAMQVTVAVSRGGLSADDAAAWPEIFTASGRDGTGFALLPFFVVVGTKPA